MAADNAQHGGSDVRGADMAQQQGHLVDEDGTVYEL
jgi:hypothetical protein